MSRPRRLAVWIVAQPIVKTGRLGLRKLPVIGILIAGLGLLPLVVQPSAARANDGTLRLSRATTGPYLVSAWTRPDPPRVGRIDLSVAVMKPDSGQAVLDAEVQARAKLIAREVPQAPVWSAAEAGPSSFITARSRCPRRGPGRSCPDERSGGLGPGSFRGRRSASPTDSCASSHRLVALGAGGALWWALRRRGTKAG